MCNEEKSDFQVVLENAKEAAFSPKLFFQFVENSEHLPNKLLFMSEHQRQNYPILWWGLQEVHLTSFPAWLDAGEPKDWTGLEDYQLKAVEGLTLFNIVNVRELSACRSKID
ncbi:hypothetical protein [Commensalibacter communis]|uniref:hypothetical protein n=1 Tax=Commensalibacter communis TaxID=2972786 RepID=UPI0022FFABBB|nr:hypothetical protein [Commensalibacter communis]CAI3950125.1 unnamed protein product [Commensalibacter communis]CAI3956385.1 unnamed protein product [Commensalibacter communis]